MPDYFNYQTTDLAKSLLLFANPGIIKRDENMSEDIYFLKVFGANCYGHNLDKKSFEHRVKWVENNTSIILIMKTTLLLLLKVTVRSYL